jgi:alkanesulfonate monooxygenase SsuD/methylene tetrahydromethanopterin reductase-like flavin-dependent oxidoreductase (luciferase family)
MFLGIISGNRKLLQPPVDNMDAIWSEYEKEMASQMLVYSFIGSPKTIGKNIEKFVAENKIDEIMITSNIFDQQAKLDSFELFAKVMKGQI